MNTHRTNGRRVTVGLPTRFELLDKDGRRSAVHEDVGHLADLAHRFWPDQEQDEDRTGKGWDVQVAGCE
jgi:hypothetical protein